MDQGVAAVLGAAVGVIGALGTAIFAYGATRAQTRDAGMVEHGHWLREKRLAACTAFLEALDQVRENLDAGEDLDIPDVEEHGDAPLTEAQRADMRTAARLLRDQAKILQRARAGVDQFGPDRLAKLSGDVVDALRMTATHLEFQEERGRPLSDEAFFGQIMAQWETAESAFRIGARRVMETPPRRRSVLGR